MANITTYLNKILSAIYGEEVRGSIHDALKAVNAEATKAADDAATSASNAEQAIATANTAAGKANTAAGKANTAATTANAAAERAEAAAGGAITDKTVAFTQASTRANINAGESMGTLLGKIKKWFADLGTAAFQAVANNLTTTVAGSVLDARQGKVLKDGLDTVSDKLAAASVTNLDTLNETGIYYFSGTATGNPKEGMAGFVIHLDKPETKAQFIIGASGASYTLLWKRRYATSAWSEWSEFRPSTYDPYFVPECSNAESNASRFQRIANAIIGNVNIKTAEAATSIQFSLPSPASTGFIIRQYSFDGKVFRMTYDSANKIWNMTREDGDITAGLWIRFPMHYMIN